MQRWLTSTFSRIAFQSHKAFPVFGLEHAGELNEEAIQAAGRKLALVYADQWREGR
jgi:hypothetical protein